MKKKSVPLRQCSGCREMKEKKELLRVLRTQEGEVILDKTLRANGRGAYLCPDPACLAKARKSRALERALQVAIPEEVYARIEEELKSD